MDKSSSTSKTKTKKIKKAKSKVLKKKRSNNGPTCSTFLSELKRRFTSKKKSEQDTSSNIVQTIVGVLNKALPIKFYKKPIETEIPLIQPDIKKVQSVPEPMQDEIMDVVEIPEAQPLEPPNIETANDELAENDYLVMPRMPIVDSEELKLAAINTRKLIVKEDISTNTGTGRDIANEILKHVNTLRKISLIAEEFNQKNSKNLKEIVDSVQKDLIKKLNEIEAEPSNNTMIQDQLPEVIATTSSV